jgi:hypothetical protein
MENTVPLEWNDKMLQILVFLSNKF